MGHPNEDLLRRYAKAASAGDVATLDELFADDVVLHIAGDSALSGELRGKDAVFGFFAHLAERSAGTAELRLREALVDDWFAVALVDAKAQVGDTTIDEPGAVVCRIADGRFVEFWSHHYDQPKMDRLWGVGPEVGAR